MRKPFCAACLLGFGLICAFLNGCFPAPVLAQSASVSSSTSNSATTADLSTPERTLASFAVAIVQGDWDNAVRCVVGASTSELTAQFKTDPKMPFSDIIIKRLVVTPSGDRLVTVHCVPYLVMVNGTEGTPAPLETLSLRRSDTGWQIVPVSRATFHPGKDGIFTDLSFLLANPDVGLAARRKAREVAQQEKDLKKLDSLVAAPPGLSVGNAARLYHDQNRRPVRVAKSEADEEAFATYIALKKLRDGRDLPFSNAADGFNDADLHRALTAAKNMTDRLVASGDITYLPHSTPVRIVAYIKPRPLRESLLSTENELQAAQHPSDDSNGIWQVDVLGGEAKGERVWVYDITTMEPDSGDYVVLNIPGHATEKIPGASDPEAGNVLRLAEGQASNKAVTQFNRLLREKRIVLFPPGLRCTVEGRMFDGILIMVNPLSGAGKGLTFFVRTSNVRLVP